MSFTDGSCSSNRHASGAFSMFHAEPHRLSPVFHHASRIDVPWAADSFVAELFAILLCLWCFVLDRRNGPPARLHLFCNSRAALDVISGAAVATGYPGD